MVMIIMEKTFIRVRSVKDCVISALAIIIGSVMILLPTGTPINITGFFLLFAGLVLVLVLKSGYKEEQTGESFQKKEYYFQQAMNAAISSAIESKPATIDLSQKDKGNALKLDLYYSKKSGKAYLQLFEYVPYRYEPCSRMCEHPLTNVEKLIS